MQSSRDEVNSQHSQNATTPSAGFSSDSPDEAKPPQATSSLVLLTKRRLEELLFQLHQLKEALNHVEVAINQVEVAQDRKLQAAIAYNTQLETYTAQIISLNKVVTTFTMTGAIENEGSLASVSASRAQDRAPYIARNFELFESLTLSLQELVKCVQIETSADQGKPINLFIKTSKILIAALISTIDQFLLDQAFSILTSAQPSGLMRSSSDSSLGHRRGGSSSLERSSSNPFGFHSSQSSSGHAYAASSSINSTSAPLSFSHPHLSAFAAPAPERIELHFERATSAPLSHSSPSSSFSSASSSSNFLSLWHPSSSSSLAQLPEVELPIGPGSSPPAHVEDLASSSGSPRSSPGFSQQIG